MRPISYTTSFMLLVASIAINAQESILINIVRIFNGTGEKIVSGSVLVSGNVIRDI